MSAENYVVQVNKCLIPFEQAFEDAINGKIKAFVSDINVTKPLSSVFNSSGVGITMYKVCGNTDTTIYPVKVSTSTQDGNGAVVALVNIYGAGMFIFEYEGAIYICHAYAGRGGVSVGSWYRITTTEVTSE